MGRGRKRILMAVLLCCVGLCGCGKNGIDGKMAGNGREKDRNESEQSANLANPWKEMTEEEAQKTDVGAFRLPAEAKNVLYRYLEEEHMMEVQFEWKAYSFTARKQSESGLEDISGMFYDWVIQDDVTVGSFRGQVKTAYPEQQTVSVCLWYQDEEQKVYSLSVSGSDLSDIDIRALAEEMCGSQEK